MTDVTYNVIFAGQIVNGADPARVRENVAKVFRMDVTKVEALFSGKRVVVKKQADQATAMKLRALMKQAGAVCELEPINASDGSDGSDASGDVSRNQTGARQPASEPAQPAAASTVVAPQPVAGTSSAASSGSAPAPAVEQGELQTVGTIRTGGTGFSGPFQVAPSGTELAEQRPIPAPVVPDISHLTMAEAGADLGEKKRDQAVEVPDISHLSVAPPGADLSE